MLEATQRDQQELTDQLVDAENLAGKLMSLYVATYQLHVSLDPVEVQNAIAEIAKDLLGASSFALLIKDDVEGGCEVALSLGDARRQPLRRPSTTSAATPWSTPTLADGVLRLEQQGDSEALAAVPLRVEEAIVGALVILRLLDHKATPLVRGPRHPRPARRPRRLGAVRGPRLLQDRPQAAHAAEPRQSDSRHLIATTRSLGVRHSSRAARRRAGPAARIAAAPASRPPRSCGSAAHQGAPH